MMKTAFFIVLPIAFLLLLQFPIDSAAETLDAADLNQQSSDTQRSSRVKRGGYNMNRLARSLHMLRLGKRSAVDEAFPLAPTPEMSPENIAKMEELLQQLPYYASPYADPYVDEDGDDGDLFYPYAVDDFEDQHFRHRRSEPSTDEGGNQLGYSDDSADDGTWKRSRMSMLRLGKRQNEGINDEFSDEKRFGRRQMSMLRLGKRPMNMLRLGKRPMNMLRLGKRPMNMLRLGKRPMNSLRLGKRPMNMLRLGKRPMNMLRLGKRQMSMLRLGKRSVETQEPTENVANA